MGIGESGDTEKEAVAAATAAVQFRLCRHPKALSERQSEGHSLRNVGSGLM